MQTFFMLGKYSAEAVKEISADRTEKAKTLIKELGGEVNSMYALLGGFDIAFIVSLPSSELAMKASLGLAVLTGIAFTTYPAVTVEDFDRMLWEGINFYKT